MKVFSKVSLSNQKRLLITLAGLSILLIGMRLQIPGTEGIKNNLQTGNYLLDNISGGNTTKISYFTLNILPAINASIILELLKAVFPPLKKLNEEDNQYGEKQFQLIKKLLILVLALIQSISKYKELSFSLLNNISGYPIFFCSCLVTGSLLTYWISEWITEKGIANGSSLIICINILGNKSRVQNFISLLYSKNILELAIKIIIFLCLLESIIVLYNTKKNIPFISAQQLTDNNVDFSLKEKNRNFIPLKLNQAGVLPIIFAASFSNLFISLGQSINYQFFFNIKDQLSLIYSLIFYIFIILFSYFYSFIVWNPKKITEDLNKNSCAIPGIRPGRETENYLNKVLFRISILGGFLLASITTIIPYLLGVIGNQNNISFEITSLMIIIGVILEILKNIKSLQMSSFYKNSINF